jgi:hypothetical protein
MVTERSHLEFKLPVQSLDTFLFLLKEVKDIAQGRSVNYAGQGDAGSFDGSENGNDCLAQTQGGSFKEKFKKILQEKVKGFTNQYLEHCPQECAYQDVSPGAAPGDGVLQLHRLFLLKIQKFLQGNRGSVCAGFSPYKLFSRYLTQGVHDLSGRLQPLQEVSPWRCLQ